MLNIYKASAGSGKTYTLTREYLKLLLGRHDPETGKWVMRKRPEQAHRHILAITFTNKATQEMTRRIIDELALLGHRDKSRQNDRSPYAEEFTALFNTDERTLSHLASDVLDDLLFDFAYFHVSTIDAFFQNVLRIFAREIEMPDNFELELDNRYTISIGVNEMFNSINYRDPIDPLKKKERRWLSSWLTRYMSRMLETGRSINLFSRTSSLYNDLISTFTRLIDEDFKLNSKLIIDYLSVVERLPAFEKGIDSAMEQAKARVRQCCERVIQMGDYTNLNRHVRTCIDAWACGNFRDPSATVIAAIGDETKRYVKAYRDRGQIPASFDAAIIEACEAGRYCAEFSHFHKVLKESLSVMGLLGCLLRYIEDYCKDNNLIMLSETNTLLRDIINDDDTPFVYERLGYYLRHFLIDEFQDTSRMQWENLKPLVMESLSHGHENLVIGDEKQCIYRFRNSDPALLGHQVCDSVAEIYGDNSVSIKGTELCDNNNWRSSREVVMFNNSIFHALAREIDNDNDQIGADPMTAATATYSTVIQQIPQKRDCPCGHVKIFFQPPENNDSEENRDEDSGHDDDTYALDKMTAEVSRMLSAGYRPKQIAILVRTHREGEAVIKRLMSCAADQQWPHGKIDVTSTDSMDIASSAAVKMIISILRLSLTPEYTDITRPDKNGEDITATRTNPAWMRAKLLQRFEYFLHRPERNADGTYSYPSPDQALSRALDLMRPKEDLSEESLERRKADETIFSNDNPAESKVLKCPSLPAIVEKIIARYIAPEAMERETIFLTAFTDLVYDFCQRGTADIRSFLEWWDRGGCRSGLASGSDTDAINVMTIHQSKGLEFPCVILPFADWEMTKYSTQSQPNYGWYSVNPKAFPGIAPEIIPPLMPFENSRKLLEIEILHDQAAEFGRKQKIDALNVAYVALTRAVNELVIITREERPRTKDNLGQYIARAIRSLTRENIEKDMRLNDRSRDWILPLSEYFDGSVLTLGNPTAPHIQEKKDPDRQEFKLPLFVPGDNETIITLSKTDLDYFDFNVPRHRGNFLHKVMSRVRKREDMPLALRRAAYRAHLTEDQTEMCRQALQQALDDPRTDRWFVRCRRILNEYTISSDGEIDRRPDRIVWTSDGTIDIIDYKFGEHDDRYSKQVRRYVSLMRRAGYNNVRGFLWYPLEQEILRVSDNGSDNN